MVKYRYNINVCFAITKLHDFETKGVSIVQRNSLILELKLLIAEFIPYLNCSI